MTYEQIKNKIPEGIPRKKRKVRPVGPKAVLIFFAVTMLIFAVFGSLIQYALGMVGVLITELFFLIISILYVKWKGISFREVFPIRKPKLSAIFGTILLWIGTYMMAVILNLLLTLVYSDFPTSSDSETILSSGMNWVGLFFIVAVVPAICEEALHRGVIQYGMKQKIRNPWMMALVIGLIFGLFHMDLSKFFTTAVLGGVMGWIMFRTDNMVYSSLLHFVHNGSQLLIMALVPGLVTAPGTVIQKAADLTILAASDLNMDNTLYYAQVLISYGVMLIILGILMPLFLYTGNYLLMKDIAPRRPSFFPKEKAEAGKLRKKLFLPSLILAGIGILIILTGCIFLI